jgi:hypothetical protein
LKKTALFLVSAAVVFELASAQTIRLNKPSAAPVAPAEPSKAPGLNTRELWFSNTYQRLYMGQFEDFRYGDTAAMFPVIFSQSATAYAGSCPQYIAPDSPVITIEKRTQDGAGNTVLSESRKYVVERRFHAKTQEYGHSYMRPLIGEEVLVMIKRNGCDSPQTLQYMENLLRYAEGKPPVQKSPSKLPVPKARPLQASQLTQTQDSIFVACAADYKKRAAATNALYDEASDEKWCRCISIGYEKALKPDEFREFMSAPADFISKVSKDEPGAQRNWRLFSPVGNCRG